jgi:hypothetical protein
MCHTFTQLTSCLWLSGFLCPGPFSLPCLLCVNFFFFFDGPGVWTQGCTIWATLQPSTFLQDWEPLELDKSETSKTKDTSSFSLVVTWLYSVYSTNSKFLPCTSHCSRFLFFPQNMSGNLDSISVFIIILNVSILSNSESVSGLTLSAFHLLHGYSFWIYFKVMLTRKAWLDPVIIKSF